RLHRRIILQGFAQLGRLDLLALIQPVEELLNDLLALVESMVLEKAVVEAFTRHGAADLPVPLMILQFGVVDHAVLSRIDLLPIDLEHHLFGLERHRYDSSSSQPRPSATEPTGMSRGPQA